MKRMAFASLVSLALTLGVDAAQAQVAGSTTLGIAVAQVQEVAVGWSAKKQIIGHTVYNEAGEKVGKIKALPAFDYAE